MLWPDLDPEIPSKFHPNSSQTLPFAIPSQFRALAIWMLISLSPVFTVMVLSWLNSACHGPKMSKKGAILSLVCLPNPRVYHSLALKSSFKGCDRGIHTMDWPKWLNSQKHQVVPLCQVKPRSSQWGSPVLFDFSEFQIVPHLSMIKQITSCSKNMTGLSSTFLVILVLRFLSKK